MCISRISDSQQPQDTQAIRAEMARLLRSIVRRARRMARTPEGREDFKNVLRTLAEEQQRDKAASA